MVSNGTALEEEKTLTYNTHKHKASQLIQYVATSTACLLSFSIGCMLGWTAPTGPLLLQGEGGFNVTDNDISWIGSLLPIGAALSCLPAGFLTDHFGRKNTLLGIVPIFILAWGLIIWATSVGMMYAGRFVSGICVGAVCVVTPVYTSEICEKRIRGSLGSYFELFMVLGVCFSYIAGCFLNVFWLSVVCATFPIIFGVAFLYFSETPVYYLSKNQPQQARKALKFYRGSKFDLDAELLDLASDGPSDNDKEPLWQAFKTPQAIKSVGISFGLMIFQQLSGINAVIFYTTAIFEDVGSSIKPEYATIITGIVEVLATFSTTLIIERLGRRILLLLSAAMMCLSALVVGVYFHLKINQHDVSSISWLPLTSFCVYLIFFSIGFGPVPWVMIPEILPIRIKGIASSMATVVNWFFAFLVTKLFVDFVNMFGADVTYWTFSVLNALGTVFCYFLFETKGKSFQEIQDILTGGKI